jgi:hypothetical protein
METNESRLMNSRLGPLFLGISLLSMATPASALDHPPYLPTRDVAVTYRAVSEDNHVPNQLQVAYSAATGRLRVEGGAQGFVIVDLRAQRVILVMSRERSWMELPPQAAALARTLIPNESMGFTRKGSDRVAGFSCTIWDVSSEHGSGTVCMTADGVLLRGQGSDHQGRSGELEATKVVYAPQPDSTFEPPVGYRQFDPADLLRKLPR